MYIGAGAIIYEDTSRSLKYSCSRAVRALILLLGSKQSILCMRARREVRGVMNACLENHTSILMALKGKVETK
jgi:hypothetical protein